MVYLLIRGKMGDVKVSRSNPQTYCDKIDKLYQDSIKYYRYFIREIPCTYLLIKILESIVLFYVNGPSFRAETHNPEIMSVFIPSRWNFFIHFRSSGYYQ